MSIVSLVTAERDRYVAHFEETVAEAIAANPQSARELLISVNEDSLPYPYRYVRVDVIGKRSDGSVAGLEIWLDPGSEAEGRGFVLESATIEIYPFTWCAATVAFNRPLSDVSKLEERLTHLLDVGDERWSDDSSASNAIHSATQIETNGELWYLTIDFGTAPAEALLDLIDFLLAEGSTRVLVQTEAQNDWVSASA